ncbi:MAG: glutamate--tRNA ligase [Myxococcales bacterium]|jgi:glutamyl-tRNA synthetase|nr:glutamate--tRNA ligase [Myxococcales bacterium]
MTVRVRIAPSPTGDPHVGTAYIALFNYAFAKKNGGQFVLRIEDTDRTRSTPESEAAILRALKWVGLQWDEGPDIGGPFGPYRQSERADIYRRHADLLIEKGEAYRCFCTSERLSELRKAQMAAKAGNLGYDGLCRVISKEESDRRAAAGEPFVVRLAMPKEGECVLRDRHRGEIRFANAGVDDQVLLKTDGFPTYHLANVVDDHLMGITHVIRAEEWISSSPKHLRLYEAFGWQAPEFIHMPLLRNRDKTKISKRKNPVSLDYYRDAGLLPEALRNFLALMGWSIAPDREKFTLEEMVEHFDIDRVSIGEPVFDLVKLMDLNGQYIRELSDEAIVDRLLDWRFSRESLESIAPLLRERMKTLADFMVRGDFFFTGDIDYRPLIGDLVSKNRTPKETAEILQEYVEKLDEPWAGERRVPFDDAALETFSRAFAEAKGWKVKELFSAVRTAVTGKVATPPLFSTMRVLGREISRKRLRDAVDALRAH